MTVGLVLSTHSDVGTALLTRASEIQGFEPNQIQLVEAAHGRRPDPARLQSAVEEADRGCGVLVMTDLPGATPTNLVSKVRHDRMKVISGLNLPMLIRAWSYRERNLEELVQLALDGGRMAIMEIC
jgi:mannose/fructose-specific phosphotransferase system component IIA